MKQSAICAAIILSSELLGGWIASERVSPQAAAHAEPQRQVVPTPEHWVPLSSNYDRDLEPGIRRPGMFYRGKDGSTRYDTGITLDAITAIAINNYTHERHYRWTKSQGFWSSQPMQLPPGGLLKPRGFVVDAANPPASEKFEEFDVLRFEQGDMVMLRAPQLNMLTVVETERNCKNTTADCTARHYNIRIGDQPAHLFEPPPGVKVVSKPEPSGVYRKPPGREP